MGTSTYRSGVLYAIGTSLSWALIPIFIKPASEELTSSNISCVRLLMGFLGLLVISGLKPGWQERCKEIIKPAILGGLLFAYHYWSYIEGIAWSGPALGRILIGLGSVFLALMGIFLYKEDLGRIQKLGVALAFAGVSSFTFSLYGNKLENVNLPAVLVLISSATVWATYAGIQRNASKANCGQEFLTIMFAVAALCTATLTTPSQFLTTSPTGLIMTVILGLLTVSGYYCFAKSIGSIPASHLSVITCVSPLITLPLLLAVYSLWPGFIEAEAITLEAMLFASLSMVGVLLVVLKQR